LDTDSNNKIDLAEFKSKIKAMHMPLDNDEMTSLFRQMDANNDG